MIAIEKVTVLPRADEQSAVEVIFVDGEKNRTTLTFTGEVRTNFYVNGNNIEMGFRLHHPQKGDSGIEPLPLPVGPL